MTKKEKLTMQNTTKKPNKSILFFTVLVAIVAVGIFVFLPKSSQTQKAHSTPTTDYSNNPIQSTIPSVSSSHPPSPSAMVGAGKSVVSSQKQSITLTFVGDIMLDRNVWAKIQSSGNNNYPFAKIGTLFSGSDKNIANLEGPLTSRGTHAVTGGSLLFSFDPKLKESLKQAGLNIVSLANNHTYNQGSIGLADTKSNLDDVQIKYFGNPKTVSDTSVDIEQIGDWKIALIGWNTIEVTDPDEQGMIDLIKKTRPSVDKIIIVPHWGVEYQPQTKTEIAYAHDLIDAGADIIIGGHPHVVQGTEIYNNKPIVYSLGNFVFDQYFSDETQQGLGIKLHLSGQSTTLDLIPLDLRDSQPKTATGATKDTIIKKIIDDSDLTEPQISQLKQNNQIVIN
jgi:poly-gamma-glutamate synthesis protein (capsule biosynthesis protein)